MHNDSTGIVKKVGEVAIREVGGSVVLTINLTESEILKVKSRKN